MLFQEIVDAKSTVNNEGWMAITKVCCERVFMSAHIENRFRVTCVKYNEKKFITYLIMI